MHQRLGLPARRFSARFSFFSSFAFSFFSVFSAPATSRGHASSMAAVRMGYFACGRVVGWRTDCRSCHVPPQQPPTLARERAVLALLGFLALVTSTAHVWVDWCTRWAARMPQRLVAYVLMPIAIRETIQEKMVWHMPCVVGFVDVCDDTRTPATLPAMGRCDCGSTIYAQPQAQTELDF